METHTHHNRNAPHSVETAWINSFTVLQTEVRFIFIFPLLHADRVCWWIDHWLHSRFSLLVRSQGLVPPICEQLLSQVKKKKSLSHFPPLPPFLPPQSSLPTSFPPSLPPSSASSAVWAERLFSQPLWRSNEEKAAIALLIAEGLGCSEVPFVFQFICVGPGKTNNNVADLADPSIECEQVGSAIVHTYHIIVSRWGTRGMTDFIQSLSFFLSLQLIYIFNRFSFRFTPTCWCFKSWCNWIRVQTQTHPQASVILSIITIVVRCYSLRAHWNTFSAFLNRYAVNLHIQVMQMWNYWICAKYGI